VNTIEAAPDWDEIFPQLCAAKKEYTDTFTGYYEPTDSDFIRWLDVNYGVILYRNFNGIFEHEYSVSDEEKYLFFMLKFTHE
jgi:hypothetical protein